MKKHTALIEELSSGLAPIARTGSTDRLAVGWLVLSAAYVVLITLLIGPMRPGLLAQLTGEPRFALETMLGVAAILWFALLAFRSSVPGLLGRRFAVAGVVLMGLWLVQYVIGFVSPALQPSELGKRNYCYVETLVYALPVILAGLYLVRRRYPLQPLRSAASVGLVAGMIPALVMQLACMYEPAHILSLHVAPGLLMAVVGAAIALRWPLR